MPSLKSSGVSKLFSLIDAKGDGVLDVDELKSFLFKLYSNLPEESIPRRYVTKPR